MVSMLLGISPLFTTITVLESGFIRFAIGVILPFPVLMLVVLPVLPASLIVGVGVEPAFVPVLVSITVPVLISIPVPVLISLTFLLVTTNVALRRSGHAAAAKR
ncbi:MAG: hypothetical protein JO249_24930 [Acidobacteria bacterium]|nr:hypothetical protein [Acidobacteriota bacterium]